MISLRLELQQFGQELMYDLALKSDHSNIGSIAELTPVQAYGLSQGGGVGWKSGDRLSDMGDVDALGLSIQLRSDPWKGKPLWSMSLTNGEGDKEHLGYIEDNEVVALMKSDAPIEFPEGEPDWKRHDDLHLRLEMEDLRARADKIEADLNSRSCGENVPGM